MKPALTAERLRDVLHYDTETGVFTWRQKVNKRIAKAASQMYWAAKAKLHEGYVP